MRERTSLGLLRGKKAFSAFGNSELATRYSAIPLSAHLSFAELIQRLTCHFLLQNHAPNRVQSRAGGRPVCVRVVLQEVDHGLSHCLQLSVRPWGSSHHHLGDFPHAPPPQVPSGVPCHQELGTDSGESRDRRLHGEVTGTYRTQACRHRLGTPTPPTPGSHQAGRPLIRTQSPWADWSPSGA